MQADIRFDPGDERAFAGIEKVSVPLLRRLRLGTPPPRISLSEWKLNLRSRRTSGQPADAYESGSGPGHERIYVQTFAGSFTRAQSLPIWNSPTSLTFGFSKDERDNALSNSRLYPSLSTYQFQHYDRASCVNAGTRYRKFGPRSI